MKGVRLDPKIHEARVAYCRERRLAKEARKLAQIVAKKNADENALIADAKLNTEYKSMERNGEIWRPVLGMPEYEVSNLGSVRSWLPHGKSRKPRAVPKRLHQGWSGGIETTRKKLTPLVALHGKPYALNTLVATAFHGIRPEGYTASWKDGNRANNRADNVYWKRNCLSEEEKEEVKSIFMTDDFTCFGVAKQYGVNVSVIWNLLQNHKKVKLG